MTSGARENETPIAAGPGRARIGNRRLLHALVMIASLANLKVGGNASQDGISLDFVPSLQHPGSAVSGTVNIDRQLATSRGITEVIVKLSGEVRTWVV